MGIVTEMLTTLGANLPLVAVGCAEVLAAAALLGRAAVMRTQSGKNRASLAPVGMNRDIQRVLRLESGEVMLRAPARGYDAARLHRRSGKTARRVICGAAG